MSDEIKELTTEPTDKATDLSMSDCLRAVDPTSPTGLRCPMCGKWAKADDLRRGYTVRVPNGYVRIAGGCVRCQAKEPAE